MKQFKYKIPLSLAIVGFVLSLLVATCDEDSSRNPAGPDGPGEGVYDPVFNADGGFVITYGMLDKRFNEITFPGTHNSYASNWAAHCENQDLSIANQLEYGIRYIEFDIDKDLYVNHNGYCAGYINERLQEIKQYVMEHPAQVITLRIGDLCCAINILGWCWVPPPTPGESYRLMNAKLIEQGLDKYIFNWNATKENDDPGKCYIPEPWPTLREMVEAGKNIMFIHSAGYGEHDIIDNGYCRGLEYGVNAGPFYKAQLQEQYCRLKTYWDPPQERQRDIPYQLFLLEPTADPQGLEHPAGDPESAAINNAGQRLYQLAKHQEDLIRPDNRVVNYIIIDYYMKSIALDLPVDIVDACNRLNYERFGIDWEHSECFWELYPYEFDDSKVEYLSQIPIIQEEVAAAVSQVLGLRELDGHENSGNIVSTPTISSRNDWRRIPEWAVDNDLWTRWTCLLDYNRTWGIDLGERKSLSEIAIAWYFPHIKPGFKVYVSNDDNLFPDFINQPENDDGWQLVAEGTSGSHRSFWDIAALNTQGIDWRYVKIKVNALLFDWPSIWEVKLYGPAE